MHSPTLTTFTPPNIALGDVRTAVPRHLFELSTSRSIYYIARHCAVTLSFFFLATCIPHHGPLVLRVGLWLLYSAWQGFAFAGIWCLGHEAGHDALSPYPLVNAALGLVLHTFILTPFYAWRSTHRAHHKATNHIGRDETYLPPTRSDFHLPAPENATPTDYIDALGETPAFTLFKLVVRQFLGFQLYLLHNRKGNRRYPPWTSHYKPSSALFRPEQGLSIVVSNIAIVAMLTLLGLYAHTAGWQALAKFYILPWLVGSCLMYRAKAIILTMRTSSSHTIGTVYLPHIALLTSLKLCASRIVTVTYLQHAAPGVPYYRAGAWTFARGSLATVDRPLFGWVGRFFLHNIGTDHVAHHFFNSVPFYNLPEVTRAIKPVLGEHYKYDETWAMVALWRSFTQCTFVEDEGDVIFFKNRAGRAVVETAL
ncbi:fatty acid desaturase-domain-containing protein [Mycena vitilis]|nr:fatty acid desaturase-domain-containing protein [Mycena vitilis]